MVATLIIKLSVIALGGALGSVLRYLVGVWVQQWTQVNTFPIGTLTVNLMGCCLIGVMGGLADHRQWLSPEMRWFILVGILGGFTTFSTFAYETLALMREGSMLAAFANLFLQVGVGLLGVWLGLLLALRWFD